MKILITGSTGFIGKNLVNYLKPKYEIYEFKGDITNLKDVQKELHEGFDVVIHLAALTFPPASWEAPEAFFETNVFGPLNLLKSYRFYNKLIHISTSHIYGKQENFPITEEANPNPLEPYAVSKLAGERLVKAWCENYKIPFTILRPFNQFGPYQKEPFLIPTLIKRAMKGKIYLYGNSERDYLYVENLCRAIELVLEKDVQGIYNICSGEAYPIGYIAELVGEIFGINQIEIRPLEQERPVDIPKLLGSYEKFNKATGWEPEISLEEGIRRTVEWYKSML
jgi:nucleoside-diphosphate-sugar epimerase